MKLNKNILKALLVGQVCISLPVVLIILAPPIFAALFLPDINIFLKILIVVILFGLGTKTAWFWWGKYITKWRIWAFNFVDEDDWITLKKWAIKTLLIWPDGADFEKTEIRDYREEIVLFNIEEKIQEFEAIEMLKLDLETPQTVGYPFNKTEAWTELVAMFFITALSFGLIYHESYELAIFMLVFILYDWKKYLNIRHLFKQGDYLIMNSEGIRMKHPINKLFLWEELDYLMVDSNTKEMIVHILSDATAPPLTVKLSAFKIKDYDLFMDYIELFIKRLARKRKR